ncbi:hypothetical protein GOP47_0025668 [Adiantum capillus-veneris]|uniref:SMP-30/Gluconolactonase/LRE-like region domain-containing protein n=1 Tax=Adiantum capillus-veneris TaxID=13818 RepID=A0A9D4Z358_ADICA|nr:hypothetical protein GOP47_0025668 [Adiantum capillus-veneris]
MASSALLLFHLHKLLILAFLLKSAAEVDGVPDLNGEMQILENISLPPGACIWKKSSGASHTPCEFEVLDVEFLDVLGKAPKVDFISHAPAHEGGVYFPNNEEFYFSSTWSVDELPEKPANLMKMSLKTGEISVVMKTMMANGMALDNKGKLVVCEQGLFQKRGFIQRIDLHSLSMSVVADNWKGLVFNSPNDVVVKSDNSIWFTDPNYGQTERFKGPSQVGKNQVYCVSATGVVTAVADGFEKPNGLAFSQDEKLLYVTDTGTSVGDGTVDLTKPHSITVFDVEGSNLSNRRVFASVAVLDGNFPSIGVPDGIKVDTTGRVYTANQDGIQVFSRGGKLLGLIRVQGAINMGFVGPQLNRMIVTNYTAIQSVQLNVQGAGLFYARSYHHS